MAIPTHGHGCITTAFPLKCSTCGSKVFFLRCNCGSKVFFDSLGDPWPIHSCFDGGSELQELIDDLVDMTGSFHEEIADRIREFIDKTGNSISSETIAKIQSHLGRAKEQYKVMSVKPTSDVTAVSGWIKVVNRGINFYSRFGLVKNEITKQLLGELGKESYSQITIRENVRDQHALYDYDAYLPTKLAQHLKLSIRKKVVLQLQSKEVLHKGTIWMVMSINILDD